MTTPARLYFVPDNMVRQGTPGWIKVEKIGRKWITCEGGKRVDAYTLVVDGGGHSSPGKCYLSQEEHQAELRLIAAWNHLRERMYSSRIPLATSLESIQTATRLLGFDLKASVKK